MRNGLIFLMLGLAFLFSGFFVVDQREVAAVYNSPLKLQIFAPGIHWQLPFSNKLLHVFTNLQTAHLATTLALKNNKLPALELKVVINYQVIAPVSYLNYIKSNSSKKLQASLAKMVLQRLQLIASEAVSLRQFEELVNSSIKNIYAANLGLSIVSVGLISISLADNPVAAIAIINPASARVISIESAFEQAQQIKATASQLQQVKLSQLRALDPKFFDYYMKIESYQQNARTRQDVPQLEQLVSSPNI